MSEQAAIDLSSIPNKVVKIITDPVGFYRAMPKDGGFVEPLVFLVVLGTVAGLIQAIVSLIGFGPMGGFLAMGLIAIILMPIVMAIFGFIGAAIIYVIWMIMGSKESYETAYRCIAYTAAIMPITALLHIIPYVGTIAGIVWMTYLMVIASIEVQKIRSTLAYAVFGVLGLLFLIINVGGEYTSRQAFSTMEEMQKNMGKMGDMSPEEAGKALGDFFKGLEKAKGK